MSHEPRTTDAPNGDNIVAGRLVRGTGRATRAVDPRTGQAVGPEYPDADMAQLAAAVDGAVDACGELGADRQDRAVLLDEAADRLDAEVEVLVRIADQETALGRPRLTGEVGRMTGQLRRFAAVVRDGRYLDVVIDTADPARTPPRPDLRRMLVPLGPVAVFGAGNFPFAFSVAGGDTASALAAGCPVLAKAHPAHPGTSELVARILTDAISHVGLHPGAFSLLHGASTSVGAALVTHPSIRAVGFTGSTAGGRSLFDAAAGRSEPIPVYAEMGSTNPVFVTAGAIEARSATIAQALAGSVLASTGQFCTKPGVVVVPDGARGDAFVGALRDELAAIPLHPLLTPSIATAFDDGTAAARAVDGVRRLLPDDEHGGEDPVPVLLECDEAAFRGSRELREERFGPFALVVRAAPARWAGLAASLDGMLVATLHAEDGESTALRDLVHALLGRAGRLVVNGVPTGVAVTTAMHHGGPYPATTAPWATSVGDRAIARFLRPVALQDAPEALLPAELLDDNPTGVLRTVDGDLTVEPLAGTGGA